MAPRKIIEHAAQNKATYIVGVAIAVITLWKSEIKPLIMDTTIATASSTASVQQVKISTDVDDLSVRVGVLERDMAIVKTDIGWIRQSSDRIEKILTSSSRSNER